MNRLLIRLALFSLIAIAIPLVAVSSRAGEEPIPFYEYKEDLGRLVRIELKNLRFYGRFDAAGNFLPTSLGEPMKTTFRSEIHDIPLVNMISKREGDPWDGTEAVYEFRSGFLIRGALNRAGDFVPKEGEKVTSFKDYLKSEQPLRIYNLPGKLVPVVMRK